MRFNRTPNLLLILITSYVFLQLIWWAYMILDLQSQVFSPELSAQKTVMILGEGAVFIALLILAFVQLNKAYKRELELAHQQQNFVLGVTHELKTPLSALKLSLQTLKRKVAKEDQDIITLALEEESRLESFIEDLLAIKMLDKKEWVKQFTDLNFREFIKEQVSQFQKTYPQQNLVIEAENVILNSDTQALKIILSNLIDNACKYSPNGSEIRVVGQRKNHQYLIKIKDQALAIPFHERQKIFEKFYRIPGSKNEIKGSGIGLYLVKNFAQVIGAKIKLENPKETGNIFTLSLPLKQ